MSDHDEPTPPASTPYTSAGRSQVPSTPATDAAAMDEAAAPPESAAPAPPEYAPPAPTIELTDVECRVLGALIEKEFVTPDVYPMTTKAIATACNQKTNRDPVVDYAPVLIDSTLLELRQRSLVRRVHTPGSRSTKHRQTLDEALSLDPGELALLSVLMLRGPQTIGELRLRSERQHGFEDLEATERCLRGLAARSTPLVRELERQPGQKEERWDHQLHDPEQAEAAQANDASSAPDASRPTVAPDRAASPTAAAPAPPAPATSAPSSGSPVLARVEQLENEVATLRRQLASLAEKLGEPLE